MRNTQLTESVALFVALLGLVLVGSCGTPKKIDVVRSQQVAATLALDRQEIVEENKVIASKRDTIVVKDDTGNEQFLMHAVKDEETGEMVATEMLDAVIITARFRNVAERHGKIGHCSEEHAGHEVAAPFLSRYVHHAGFCQA